VQLAQTDAIGPGAVAQHLLRKQSKKQAASVRSLQSRLEMLAQLVASGNLLGSGTGITPDTLISYW
jgi:hypothetical protein